ncbi:hypothetical protein HYZ64_00370 [Candidatus Berkelbacteria bacterium]|nr:hypothetical protein [Candidatus Berkelbacteria bacterium]
MNEARKKVYKELAQLTTKTVLLSFFDVLALFGTLDLRRRYVRGYEDYLRYRSQDYKRFYQLFYKLKRQGVIEIYQEGKKEFVSLTRLGRQKVAKYLFQDGKIPLPPYWDGKWRVIIFDIPEQHRQAREVIRHLLQRVGCHQLQKSVYVYPHECIGLVRFLEEAYGVDEYIQFLVAERIETEVDLIAIFHEQGIIKKIKR